MATENTVVRAVTLPVAGPVDESWENVNEALRVAFRLSTDLANWAVHYLFRLDDPVAEKTPDAVKKAYLYGAAAGSFPGWAERCGGVAANAQCVFRAVQKKYAQDRFAIQVRRESSLLTYRYPYPFPVHNANWSVAFAKGPWPGEAPVVTLALPVLGRVALRLDRGPEFGRQLAMVRQFLDGTAKKGEAALYRDRKGKLLVKLVGHFPRKERGPAGNVAFVHTDPNAVLVVEVNGRRVDVTNGDHVRRLIAAHKAFRRRVYEDKKREKRMDRRQRSNLNGYVGDRCGKMRARLDTYVKQVAAQVARMCGRQGVGLVCYDDENREYMRHADAELSFPWHALKTRLRVLLGDEMGCGWIDGQFARLNEGDRESWLTLARATLSTAGKVRAHKSRPPGRSHPGVSPVPGTSSPSGGVSSTTCSGGTGRRRSSPAPSAGPGT
jgi:hypothetical protein